MSMNMYVCQWTLPPLGHIVDGMFARLTKAGLRVMEHIYSAPTDAYCTYPALAEM
jgi:hypothetical protein